jgi:hypothetical protein
MSIDTHLEISSKWDLEDIRTVMENYLDLKEKTKRKKNSLGKFYTIKNKVEIEPSIGQPDCYNFFFEIKGSKNPRRMFVITNSNENPLGPTTWMSLGSNAEAIMIMHTIAEVLGGQLEENDCNCQLESIKGKVGDHNGLPYFIKYALLNNKMEDEDDLMGLIKCINLWEINHAKSSGSSSYNKNIITGKLLKLIQEE